MKICAVLIFFVLCWVSPAKSQGVVINFDLDTNSWDVGKPLNLWLDFLATANDTVGAKYWNKAELERYGNKKYFALKRELDFGRPDYLEFISYANIRVMSIRKRGEYYKISNSLTFTNTQGGEDLYFLFHVYAGFENGELKLFNALQINTAQLLSHQKVGFINYYYPKNHQFNFQLAEKQNDFLIELAKNFNVPVVEVDYYFAETTEEIQRIKGFDFIFGDNGENTPTGVSYIFERQVFVSGTGEYYPHEIIHVLLNPHYLKSHYWINEGVATYFGMSRGKELEWHLKKLNNHLIAHPEIDLNEMLKLVRIDGTTGYSYVLGGYIVKCIYEKGGYPLLIEAMQMGRRDIDFYRLIYEFLGYRRHQINDGIRNDLKAYFSD